MATSKSKKKTAKKSSNKPKADSTVKSEAVDKKTTSQETVKQETVSQEETVVVAEVVTVDKSDQTDKSAKSDKTDKSEHSEESKDAKDTNKSAEAKKPEVVASTEKKKNPFAGFFARKFDPSENILTIFQNPRLYGALIGEALGTMLLTMIFLTLGVYQPLYVLFALFAIVIAMYNLSGANLNPIITVGMMATRRMSAIRGVLYIVVQIVGAWLGYLLVNAFRLAGDSAVELPVMTEIGDNFWIFTAIEFVGALIIAFFFARALSYKRSAFTFGAVVAFGTITAMLFSIIVSGNFLGFQNNFIHNPAVAFMYQIIPTAASDLGELLGSICIALAVYAIIPMVGGVIGFYISDIAQQLSTGDLKQS